jgi:hypothetical protein
VTPTGMKSGDNTSMKIAMGINMVLSHFFAGDE